jgi:hypothetical protein
VEITGEQSVISEMKMMDCLNRLGGLVRKIGRHEDQAVDKRIRAAVV